MPRPTYTPTRTSLHSTIPFQTAEEAWFWFIQANQARLDGARYTSAKGNIRRPCEPVDILKILDRLYRTRRLMIDHFRVLRFYGLRMMPPESWRPHEARAATLWAEAMRALETVFISRGIIEDRIQNVVPFRALVQSHYAGAYQ